MVKDIESDIQQLSNPSGLTIKIYIGIIDGDFRIF